MKNRLLYVKSRRRTAFLFGAVLFLMSLSGCGMTSLLNYFPAHSVTRVAQHNAGETPEKEDAVLARLRPVFSQMEFECGACNGLQDSWFFYRKDKSRSVQQAKFSYDQHSGKLFYLLSTSDKAESAIGDINELDRRVRAALAERYHDTSETGAPFRYRPIGRIVIRHSGCGDVSACDAEKLHEERFKAVRAAAFARVPAAMKVKARMQTTGRRLVANGEPAYCERHSFGFVVNHNSDRNHELEVCKSSKPEKATVVLFLGERVAVDGFKTENFINEVLESLRRDPTYVLVSYEPTVVTPGRQMPNAQES